MRPRSFALSALIPLLLVQCSIAPEPTPQALWPGDLAPRSAQGEAGPGSERARRSQLLLPDAPLRLQAPEGAGPGRIRATAWVAGPATDASATLLGNGLAIPISAEGPTPVSWPVASGGALLLEAAAGSAPVELVEPIFLPEGAPARRLLLIFVDTLRADHLGAWGYARDSSPNIDALAARGQRFADASSPAPWTLPATRGAWSGRHPEAWLHEDTVPLAEAFVGAGWVTAAIVANPWLSADHAMTRGWSDFSLWPGASAEEQVDRGIAFLQAEADRDHLLLLHLQDPHLPYREPEPHRSRWAGAPPPGLSEGFTGRQLRALGRPAPDDARRTHVIDRYDQNIAYVDAEVGRLLAAAGPDATVLLFSDHGEEFWEHGGVEHGHALGPEIINIPLILTGPGIQPGVNADPVSLLDILPTLRARFGLDADPHSDGRDLLGPTPGSPSLVAGRLLYGPSGWALRQGDWRWTARGEDRKVTNLGSDPRELAGQPPQPADDTRAAAALSAALGLPAGPTWRLARPGVAAQSSSAPAATVQLYCPGGFAAVWAEPRPGVTRSPPEVDGAWLRLPRTLGAAPTGEVFFHRLQETGDCRLEVADPAAPPDAASVPATLAVGDAAIVAGPRGRQARVDRVIVPQLPSESVGQGRNMERSAALKALGYEAD